MTVTVKICGINSAAAADAAVRAGADMAGLNFHRASPRYIHEQARALADRLRGRVLLVALLADPDDEAIDHAVRTVRPDFVQLHGRESAARLAQVRERFGVKLIKALAVSDEADLASISAFEPVSDMMLFDAKAPEGASRPGGHGVPFDWKILTGRKFARPWLLAGGLNPDNVSRALSVSGARGVDASSGVETAPGVKDVALIEAFVNRAKQAHLARETNA